MKNETLKPFRSDIQVLRGLAVLAVVLFHAWEKLLPAGYLGVDIFFVISGFVVTPLILRVIISESLQSTKRSKLISFYKRRFFRLAPALGYSLIFSAAMIFVFGDLNDLQRFARQGILTSIGLGNYGAVKYAGNYFAPNPNPLIHTWSLSVEEQIYLVLPVLLLTVLTIVKTLKIHIAYLLILLSSVSIFLFPELLNFLYNKSSTYPILELNFYSPISRLWQFLFGGLVFFASNSNRLKKERTSRFMRYGSITLLLSLLLNQVPLDYRISVVITSILVGLVIDSRAILHFPNRVNNTFAWLGDRSYSIYLLHMPLIYIAKFSPFPMIIENRGISTFIAVALSSILGAFTFSYVEERFRIRDLNSVKKRVSTKKLFLGVIILPMVLFVGIDTSAKQNHKLVLGSSKSLATVDLHVLSDRGCVDIVFDPVKCIWRTTNVLVGNALLVGDSQVWSNADGVITALNATGFDVVASSSSGCPMLLVKTSGDKPIDCSKWGDDVLKYVEKIKPSIVILSNRTFGYLNPDSEWRTFLDVNERPIVQRDAALLKYSEALQNTISRIVAAGSKVIIIQDIPEPKSFGGQSIGQVLFGIEAASSIPISEMNVDSKAVDLEIAMTKTNKMVSIFSPIESLCQKSMCLISRNGSNVYLDGWHLSKFGSMILQEKFATLIKDRFLAS